MLFLQHLKDYALLVFFDNIVQMPEELNQPEKEDFDWC